MITKALPSRRRRTVEGEDGRLWPDEVCVSIGGFHNSSSSDAYAKLPEDLLIEGLTDVGCWNLNGHLSDLISFSI